MRVKSHQLPITMRRAMEFTELSPPEETGAGRGPAHRPPHPRETHTPQPGTQLPLCMLWAPMSDCQQDVSFKKRS